MISESDSDRMMLSPNMTNKREPFIGSCDGSPACQCDSAYRVGHRRRSQCYSGCIHLLRVSGVRLTPESVD